MARNKEYILQYFVGLLEGDGSIQVNHWRRSSLQFRLIIKLSNTPANYTMLIKIAKVVGGCVKYTNKEKFVIWVVNDRKEIKKILQIFNKYPLLTGRKICQLNWMKKCLENIEIDKYFADRESKYDELHQIIESKPFKYFENTEYFKIWLAGFVEAEGCFSLRKNNNSSFSVSQKHERHLLEAIKNLLCASNKVRQVKGSVFILEIYKRSILIEIGKLFEDYPLLGEKGKQYEKFFKHFFRAK